MELCHGPSSGSGAKERMLAVFCLKPSDERDCPPAVSEPSSVKTNKKTGIESKVIKNGCIYTSKSKAFILTSSLSCLLQKSIMGFRAPLADHSILKAAL